MKHVSAHLGSPKVDINKKRAWLPKRASSGVWIYPFEQYYDILTWWAPVNTPDGRTLSIQPWEKAMLEPIEKAIMVANLGLNPQNNGELIMINIPSLTEERRRDLVKQARAEGEDAKVSIRNSRKEANDEIKALKEETISDDLAKDAEDQVQKLTDSFVKKVDDLMTLKEADIMKV